MVGWHHRCDGHEFEQAPGVGDGQESLMCYSPWVHKELDTIEGLSHSLTHAANNKVSSLLPGCVIVPCTYMSSPGPHKEEVPGQGRIQAFPDPQPNIFSLFS